MTLKNEWNFCACIDNNFILYILFDAFSLEEIDFCHFRIIFLILYRLCRNRKSAEKKYTERFCLNNPKDDF